MAAVASISPVVYQPIPRKVDERSYYIFMNIDLGLTIANALPIGLTATGKPLPLITKQDFDPFIRGCVESILGTDRYLGHTQHAEALLSNARRHVPAVALGAIESSKKSAIRKWRKDLAARTEVRLLNGAGWEAEVLTAKDIPHGIRLAGPIEDISCFEFAFMRASVQELLETEWGSEELLSLLAELGFVSAPQPKAGDLVMFLQEGIPVHMGIWYKNKVLAKPGNEQGFSLLHTLEETYECYGNQVLFFRRSILK